MITTEITLLGRDHARAGGLPPFLTATIVHGIVFAAAYGAMKGQRCSPWLACYLETSDRANVPFSEGFDFVHGPSWEAA